jgi:hypothetical protein
MQQSSFSFWNLLSYINPGSKKPKDLITNPGKDSTNKGSPRIMHSTSARSGGSPSGRVLSGADIAQMITVYDKSFLASQKVQHIVDIITGSAEHNALVPRRLSLSRQASGSEKVGLASYVSS